MHIKKLCFILIAAIMSWLGTPLSLQAGTLEEVSTAISDHYASGAISDPIVYKMLTDMVSNAQATDEAGEAALRRSIMDVCAAFRGSGINSTAADDISSKAGP